MKKKPSEFCTKLPPFFCNFFLINLYLGQYLYLVFFLSNSPTPPKKNYLRASKILHEFLIFVFLHIADLLVNCLSNVPPPQII